MRAFLLATLLLLAGCASDDQPADTEPETEPEPDVPETPMHTASGSLTGQAESCGTPNLYLETGQVPAIGGPTDGLMRADVPLPDEAAGQDFTVQWTFDQGYLALYTIFTEDDGSVLEGDVVESPNLGNYQVSGTVPDGAGYAVLFACGGPGQADWAWES